MESLNTLTLTINQLINMFVFMIIGYTMRKRKIGGDGVSTVLSTLLVNLFLPALVFSTFAEKVQLHEMTENIYYMLAGIISILISFPLALFLASKFAKTGLEKDVYTYSFLISNIGYMGYPLVEAVFGTKMLLKMMIFCLPYQLVIYTYGTYILNPNRELSFKKIINPNITAIALGLIVGLTGIKLPTVVTSIVHSASSCMSVSAMLLTGFVLAATSVKPLLKEGKLYLAALIRGIGIPGIALLICFIFKIDANIMTIICATLAMPMGLNSIVFPEAYGGNGLTGAKTSFVSNLLCIITIPLVFSAIEIVRSMM